jgi:hypothetical protein
MTTPARRRGIVRNVLLWVELPSIVIRWNGASASQRHEFYPRFQAGAAIANVAANQVVLDAAHDPQRT